MARKPSMPEQTDLYIHAFFRRWRSMYKAGEQNCPHFGRLPVFFQKRCCIFTEYVLL